MGPWIIWLIVSVAGTSLLGPPRAWNGTDPQVHHAHYKPEPVAYRTWISSPTWNGEAKTCDFMAFALATREHLTRLRINGMEQLLDWSWSWPVMVPAGMRGDGLMVEFIDAQTGKVVATHELSAECWGPAKRDEELAWGNQ